ncbi:MAG: hypothetical protein AAF513_07725 [Pseudomonadota bacterium]
MEIVIKVCWALLAAIHFLPSLPLLAPAMVGRLYDVDPAGDVGVLLTH